mmetsp:Transcript_23945/g.74566  ORF Transcript_23945/g.74566 Transcript_23945/m.74566 type:complete len:224 (+) Transcript_23945:218-889(+)
MRTTGVSSPMVPHVNASSAAWNSASEMRRSTTVMPREAASFMSVSRVMPGRQWSAWGVRSSPALTMKMFMELVSETNPSRSSMIASAAFAWLACIFGRMLLIRLLWWIFESTHWGGLRRLAAVMSETPASLSKVATPTTGFHSARTMSVQPYTLKAGFIDDVVFSPRVSVRRMCTPSRMPLAARVWKMASRTCSRVCTFLKSMARAESCRRRRCRSSLKTLPR